MKQLTIASLGVTTLLMTACVGVTPLHPAATNVVIAEATPVRGCQLLKPLSLTTKNGADAFYRSHQVIQEDQLNQLRNATAQLGGNLFVLDTHHTTYQKVALTYNNGVQTTKHVEPTGSDSLVDHHTMSGTAYLCDAQALAEEPEIPVAKAVPKANDAT